MKPSTLSEAEYIRTQRIMLSALCLGPLLFVGVALLLGRLQPVPAGPYRWQEDQILFFILAGLTISNLAARFGVSLILQSRLQAESLFPALQTLGILRMALVEAPALFGGVLLLITGLNRYFPHEPMAWVCLFPLVVCLGAAGLDWPTGDKLRHLREDLERSEKRRD